MATVAQHGPAAEAVASSVAVRTSGLTVRFPRRAGPTLREVDLELAAGDRVLVVGPSGGGKSTLLHTLAGVVPQSFDAVVTGSLDVLGSDPREVPVARTALQVGRLGQDPATNTCLPTVLDEVALPLENRGVPSHEIGPRVERMLAAVGAAHLAGRRVSRLSGGEQQRVALAAVLVADPAVLLLDEPTSMLDPVAAAQVLELLDVHSAGRTSLLVEHRLREMAWRPERVVLVDAEGRVHEPGPLPGGAPPVRAAPDGAAPGPARTAAGEVVLGLRDGGFAQGGRTVVQGVDLDLREGQVTAVVGTNGSGKTSLLLGLAGLLPGDTPSAAGQVALAFQRPEHQFVARTALAEVAGRVDLLERVGLAGLAGADPFRLSGGQQRRLSVAAMVGLGRRVLALDEPTFGLDPEQTTAVVGLVHELATRGTCVVLATHDLELARTIADQVLVLDRGRVVAVGGRDVLADDVLDAAGLRVPLPPVPGGTG